ncbi:MAG: hypothetical protein LBT78_01225 [Tannerella sp.]|nr:hypothetical protein [Tannerella sp.]
MKHSLKASAGEHERMPHAPFFILRCLLVIAVIFTHFPLCRGENTVVVLGDSAGTHLSIDLNGGAFCDFRLAENLCNPFSWKAALAEMPLNKRNGAVEQGHFLCLGRWGSPTAGEIKAGVPHHGQASNRLWEVVSLSGDSLLTFSITTPLDGVTVERTVLFDKDHAIFKVADNIRSTISIGRLFNIVQHGTVGPPFLTPSTIIDSNADEGFMQHLAYPDPHKHARKWPDAKIDTLGRTVNLSRTDGTENYVASCLFSEDTGWITASTPEKGILIGYLWKTVEYPWLNLWHYTRDGAPWAKGLEFGTTGIGRSYQDLLAVDARFHGKSSFFFLDALENVKKSFLCFQVTIPADYKGVKELKMEGNRIVLVEKETSRPRKITIENKFIL